MKRMLSRLNKKSESSPTRNGTSSPRVVLQGDGPEAVVIREVTAFCESGAPGSPNSGDEYLHLPAIVDGAESSPSAAKGAAATIRQYLSKDYYQRGYAQYNSIMLCRILTDNPGAPFTKNFDAEFVSTVKKLLREGKDTSVQQILRETLDYFEAEKAPGNETLGSLIQMWRKEKGKGAGLRSGPVYPVAASRAPHHQHRPPQGLPPPDELAARIEEAKTTARLLVQTVQSTPQTELVSNDLVKEFAERAKSAHKSIQRYMNCENPSPDEDTMLTLIETNDQLNVAMSKHQRTLLQARKTTGMTLPSPGAPTGREANSYMPPHVPGQNVYGGLSQTHQANFGPYSSSPPRNNGPQAPLAPQGNAQLSLPPVSPQRHEQFSPPPGPPPSQRQPQQTYDYEDAYSAPTRAPAVPNHSRPESQTITSPVSPIASTSTAAYGVAENPFADDVYNAEPQPQQQKYSLFDRAKHHISSSDQPQGVAQLEKLSAAYQGTPSYIDRQDSSTNHLTMHGGSPPSAENR